MYAHPNLVRQAINEKFIRHLTSLALYYHITFIKIAPTVSHYTRDNNSLSSGNKTASRILSLQILNPNYRHRVAFVLNAGSLKKGMSSSLRGQSVFGLALAAAAAKTVAIVVPGSGAIVTITLPAVITMQQQPSMHILLVV